MDSYADILLGFKYLYRFQGIAVGVALQVAYWIWAKRRLPRSRMILVQAGAVRLIGWPGYYLGLAVSYKLSGLLFETNFGVNLLTLGLHSAIALGFAAFTESLLIQYFETRRWPLKIASAWIRQWLLDLLAFVVCLGLWKWLSWRIDGIFQIVLIVFNGAAVCQLSLAWKENREKFVYSILGWAATIGVVWLQILAALFGLSEVKGAYYLFTFLVWIAGILAWNAYLTRSGTSRRVLGMASYVILMGVFEFFTAALATFTMRF